MKMIDSMTMEFEHEAQTTRKHLERLPNDKQDINEGEITDDERVRRKE